MTIEHFNEFFTIVDSLIALNIKRRNEYLDQKNYIGDILYAKAFCTVKCDVGRNSGKTEYIKQKATKNDLIIVDSNGRSKKVFEKCEATVVAPEYLNNPLHSEFDKIYIHDAKFIFHEIDINDIYGRLAHGTQTFVLLG